MKVALKLSSLIFTLSTFLLFTSCSEVLYLSVEQMIPPEIMPKYGANSVGVVNNFSPNNVIVVNEDALIYPCNADSVKEHIALSFADAGMLDRVVVLDSLLYHPDSVTPQIFTQEKVNALCERLEVDMLYSIDYACVTINRAPRTVGRPMNTYLCSRIYTPDKDTISGTATIDKKTLDSWAYDTAQVHEYMPQVPRLLAETAIEAYFPKWKERERVFYFDRLNYALREAKVYVGEGNWDAAAEQWRSLSTSKNRNQRYMAAYNMALYYEMTDSIDQAIAQLDYAKSLAVKTDKQGNSVQVIDTALVEKYREVLVNRKKEIARLETYISASEGLPVNRFPFYMALAKAKTQIRMSGTVSRDDMQACRVAPVVVTSSITKTCFPLSILVSVTRNMPSVFFQRSVRLLWV